jgi:hypothetical protein
MSHPEVAASVVVLSYQSRGRIDRVLDALRSQDLDEPFEVVLVDSGTDGCGEYVSARYPEVRVLQSPTRLRPGPARNRGVQAAKGEVVAFLPDDGLPHSDWLRRRLELHRCGFDIVGGAIVNGLPTSYVAEAEYLLEYSALLPVDAVLAAQEIPHCLSFQRHVFGAVGLYPEDTLTGEDTLFNLRCLEAKMPVAYSAQIQMAHVGNTHVAQMVRHGYQHGRGLMQCTQRHKLGSLIGEPDTHLQCVWRALVIYPAYGLVAKARRFQRFAPASIRPLVKASPLIYLTLVATGLGALTEWRQSKWSPAPSAGLSPAADQRQSPLGAMSACGRH